MQRTYASAIANMTVVVDNVSIPKKQRAAVSHTAEAGTAIEEVDVVQPENLKPGVSSPCRSNIFQARSS